MKKDHTEGIAAVGFDLGGVVLSGNQPQLYRYLATTLGTDTYALAAAIEHYRPKLEAGSVDIAGFLGLICTDLHVAVPAEPILGEMWTHGFSEQTTVRQPVLELVERLRTNGYAVGMFTNISQPVDMIDQKRGIFNHFDVVLKSYEVGYVKPQAEAFKALCEALGSAADQTIFIDDIGANVDGAIAAGLHGIQYGDLTQVIAELKVMGVVTDG